MAALTMSFDVNACRYAAAVQTNGHRVEMISPNNIRGMLLPLFAEWIKLVGGGKGKSSCSIVAKLSLIAQARATSTISVMASLRDNMLTSSTRRSLT
jgi:hypothetical protein